MPLDLCKAYMRNGMHTIPLNTHHIPLQLCRAGVMSSMQGWMHMHMTLLLMHPNHWQHTIALFMQSTDSLSAADILHSFCMHVCQLCERFV